MKTILIKITTTDPDISTHLVLQVLKYDFTSAEVTEIKLPTDEEWLKILYEDILSKQKDKDSDISKRIAKSLSEMRLEDIKYVIDKIIYKKGGE